MSWPLSQDYNEVIQDPAGSFSDAELKTGEAVTNPLGIPLPRSGNFADVYEVRCPSGSRWAVKCFTREVAGLRERYHEISKFLHQANLPFMVDFQYLEQGIRVRGQWYPILKMQWVEGFVLNEFVRDNLDKKPILQAMGQIWLRMARRLREANLAHCDLQHGNVLLVPGSTGNSLAVKLIDYDGMCVPALRGSKSGEVGHPAFQHPERLRTGAYNQEVDRFSLLAIATGLRCLTVGGRSLWERYDNGDNLLFRQSDLQKPTESPLFEELLTIRDAQAQPLVKELYRACQGPLAKVPLLTELVPEEKPAANKITLVPVAASAAIAPERELVPEPDWDFQEEEGEEKPRRSIKKKKRRSSGKIPLWAWGAIGAGAAVLLLGVGVGTSLMMQKGSSKKEATYLAQNKHEVKTPQPLLPGPRLLPGGDAEKPPEPPPVVGVPPDLNGKPDAVKPPQLPANQQPPAEVARAKRIFQLAPSGDIVAISDEGDNTWRLMKPRTNEVIRTFTGHKGALTAVAFSADGRRALTGSEDQTVRLWDVQTGETIRTISARAPVVAVALSPDGLRGVVISSRDLRGCHLWDFETGRPHGFGFARRPLSLAFAADSQAFLAGLDRGDKDPDQVMLKWIVAPAVGVRVFRTHPESVTCVALSPDGNYAASGHAGETPSIILWEVATGKPLWQKPIPVRTIRQVIFSPDSRFLLAGVDAGVRVFRLPDGKELGQLNRLKECLVCGGFLPDSTRALFAFCEGGRVRLSSMPLPVRSPSSAPETVQVKPSPQPETQNDWSHLNIPRDITPAPKADVLRIPSGHTVATRQEYSGPLDITIVVRGMDHDVSFIAPGGAMVTFRRTGRSGHVLNVRRPDTPGRELGTLVASKPITLPANQWCTLHWEIKSTGMTVTIDKERLFQEDFTYDLTSKYPVKIRVNYAAVEVKSLVVKSLEK